VEIFCFFAKQNVDKLGIWTFVIITLLFRCFNINEMLTQSTSLLLFFCFTCYSPTEQRPVTHFTIMRYLDKSLLPNNHIHRVVLNCNMSVDTLVKQCG